MSQLIPDVKNEKLASAERSVYDLKKSSPYIESWSYAKDEASIFMFKDKINEFEKPTTKIIREFVDNAYRDKELDEIPELVVVVDFRPEDDTDSMIQNLYLKEADGTFSIAARYDSKNKVLNIDHHKGNVDGERFYAGFDHESTGKSSSTPNAIALFRAIQRGQVFDKNGKELKEISNSLTKNFESKKVAIVANHDDIDSTLSTYVARTAVSKGFKEIDHHKWDTLAYAALDADYSGDYAKSMLREVSDDKDHFILASLIRCVEKKRDLLTNHLIVDEFLLNSNIFKELLRLIRTNRNDLGEFAPDNNVVETIIPELLRLIGLIEETDSVARSAKKVNGAESVYFSTTEREIVVATAFTWFVERINEETVMSGAVSNRLLSLIIARNNTQFHRKADGSIPESLLLYSRGGEVIEGGAIYHFWLRSMADLSRYMSGLKFLCALSGRATESSTAVANTRSSAPLIAGIPVYIGEGLATSDNPLIDTMNVMGLPVLNPQHLDAIVQQIAALIEGRWDLLTLEDFLKKDTNGSQLTITSVKTHHFAGNEAGIVQGPGVEYFYKSCVHDPNSQMSMDYLKEIIRQEILRLNIGDRVGIPKFYSWWTNSYFTAVKYPLYQKLDTLIGREDKVLSVVRALSEVNEKECRSMGLPEYPLESYKAGSLQILELVRKQIGESAYAQIKNYLETSRINPSSCFVQKHLTDHNLLLDNESLLLTDFNDCGLGFYGEDFANLLNNIYSNNPELTDRYLTSAEALLGDLVNNGRQSDELIWFRVFKALKNINYDLRQKIPDHQGKPDKKNEIRISKQKVKANLAMILSLIGEGDETVARKEVRKTNSLRKKYRKPEEMSDLVKMFG